MAQTVAEAQKLRGGGSQSSSYQTIALMTRIPFSLCLPQLFMFVASRKTDGYHIMGEVCHKGVEAENYFN